MLVKYEDQEEITELQRQFSKIDVDHSGGIGKSELKNLLNNCSLEINETQIDDIFTQINYFGGDEISFSEFVLATFELKHH